MKPILSAAVQVEIENIALKSATAGKAGGLIL
jgi:hypothetical protein